MTDPRLGVMLRDDRCPKCQSRVMGNVLGNRWCVGQDCDFHVRDGQLVTAAEVRELGARCPVREK